MPGAAISVRYPATEGYSMLGGLQFTSSLSCGTWGRFAGIGAIGTADFSAAQFLLRNSGRSCWGRPAFSF